MLGGSDDLHSLRIYVTATSSDARERNAIIQIDTWKIKQPRKTNNQVSR
jgi:hypothetical protein